MPGPNIFRLCVLPCLVLAIATGTPAYAARIEPIDDDLCHFALRGPIEEGDFERFKLQADTIAAAIDARESALADIERDEFQKRGAAAMADKPIPPDRTAERKKLIYDSASRVFKFAQSEYAKPRFIIEVEVPTVCLSSPGGSFAEARKIIGYMLSGGGVATVIRAGDECDSACALIFMFGNVSAYLEARVLVSRRFIDRRLDVRGKLGLHAPYQPAEASASAAVIRKAYEEGVKAVASLLELDEVGFLTRSLVVAFLKTGANEFHYLDTIAKAGSWGVELIGYEVPTVGSSDLARACENDVMWMSERRKASLLQIEPRRQDFHSPIADLLFAENRVIVREPRFAVTRATMHTEYMRSGSTCCIARMQSHGKGKESLSIEHELTFKDQSLCSESTPFPDYDLDDRRTVVTNDGFILNRPSWFFFFPEKKLEDIAAKSAPK